MPSPLKREQMAKQEQAMPFYVGDWLKCPEVMILPPDIRGLWFDLICYMWGSVERGVMLKPSLKPYSKPEIIALVGKDCSGTGHWLDVLIDNGVCAVREDGAIYNRRMVKEENIRLKRQKAGKKGGDTTKERIFEHAKPIVVSKPLAPITESPPLFSPDEQCKIEKAKKYKYSDYVTLTRDEYMKLVVEHSEEGAKRMIEILSNYKGSKGKKYKSDYLAILNWVVGRYNEEIQKNGRKFTKPDSDASGSTTGKDYRDTL